jgi:hypothetical protein
VNERGSLACVTSPDGPSSSHPNSPHHAPAAAAAAPPPARGRPSPPAGPPAPNRGWAADLSQFHSRRRPPPAAAPAAPPWAPALAAAGTMAARISAGRSHVISSGVMPHGARSSCGRLRVQADLHLVYTWFTREIGREVELQPPVRGRRWEGRGVGG